MNSDSLNMVSRLGEGHMPWTFFLSEPQLKTTVDSDREDWCIMWLAKSFPKKDKIDIKIDLNT